MFEVTGVILRPISRRLLGRRVTEENVSVCLTVRSLYSRDVTELSHHYTVTVKGEQLSSYNTN